MLEDTVKQRPDGFSLQEAVKSNRHWVLCRTCRKKHEFYPVDSTHQRQQFLDFQEKHPAWRGCHVTMLTPVHTEKLALREQKRRRKLNLAIRDFLHNSDFKIAYQAAQSLDLTGFNSLASSATAGWSSGVIDNSANLYVDYLCALKVAAVNTAPGSDKCFYLFAATATDTTDLPTTGASSGGTVPSNTTGAALTFPSVSTLPCLMPLASIAPYPVQNIALQSGLFAIARAFNGLPGPQVWLPIVNFSGFTVAASGNAYKYRGAYYTV